MNLFTQDGLCGFQFQPAYPQIAINDQPRVFKVRAQVFLLATILSTSASAEERSEVVAKCISAFASGDQPAYEALAAEVKAWGTIADTKLNQAASACLALTTTAKSQTPDAVQAEAVSSVEAIADPLNAYLERLEGDPTSIGAIASELAGNSDFVTSSDERAKRLEGALLDYVRPLPSSKAEENLTAYQALARLVPENASYTEKVEGYVAAIEARERADKERQSGIVKKLIKKTEEFDGSSWYRHPSSPRYQDTQSYVTLYVLESGSGKRSIEFFLNYTSRTGWLFVESAQINVDGKITNFPPAQWLRDNDTEIWEFVGYRDNAALLELARQIAGSDRAVVRFSGQQFYDDHVVSQKEKSVIKDMLLAWEQMKN